MWVIRARIYPLPLIKMEATLASMKADLDKLKLKHADLDVRLGEEMRRPNPDQSVITQIKREKLKVKDAIESMESA